MTARLSRDVLPGKMMKRIRSALAAAGVVAGAYAAALVWWRMWMHNGIPGPPPYLHWFICSDGEASYNLPEMEMFGILLVVGLALTGLVQRMKRRQNQQVHGTAYRRP